MQGLFQELKITLGQGVWWGEKAIAGERRGGADGTWGKWPEREVARLKVAADNGLCELWDSWGPVSHCSRLLPSKGVSHVGAGAYTSGRCSRPPDRATSPLPPLPSPPPPCSPGPHSGLFLEAHALHASLSSTNQTSAFPSALLWAFLHTRDQAQFLSKATRLGTSWPTGSCRPCPPCPWPLLGPTACGASSLLTSL